MKRFACTLVVCLLALPQTHAQFVQQGSKLVGTGAVGAAFQGWAVALSGDGNTLVSGGFADTANAGAAWVFTRSGGVWSQQGAKLVGAGAVGAASQGNSVAISADGNTVIIGGNNDNSGAGATWVFTRSGGVWTQQGGKLVGSGAAGAANQGTSVALSADGNTALVGGTEDSSAIGAVWVFTRSGGVWTQQGNKLVGSNLGAGTRRGRSVALSADGNTALVGIPNVNSALVFTRSGVVWTQQGGYFVPVGASGAPGFGTSVSLSADGNTALLGGPTDSTNAGAAFVWTRSGGVWSQQGSKLVGNDAVGFARQGYAVSLSSDGNTALVGGYSDNYPVGAAWIWTRAAGVWTQLGSKLFGSDGVSNPNEGYAVALSSDGTTAILGGYGDNSNAGAVWVFQFPAQPEIMSISDIPADQGGKVRVTWNKSIYDALGSPHAITAYGLWRSVPPGGIASGAMMPLAKSVNPALSATYDFIASIPAVRFDSYAYVAGTLSDSTASGVHRYTYLVSAQTADPALFFISDPDSGYSVDNLAPSAPANPIVAALSRARIRLQWDRNRIDPDVAFYTLYRSTTSGFPLNQSTRLATTVDTVEVDSATQNAQRYYYRVTTVDIHGNESTPTAELTAVATGVREANFAATEFFLGQNYPNPFNPSTTISFSIPQQGTVQLRIIDLLGREVAALIDGEERNAGTYRVTWNAGTSPSGIYFYRLQAGNFTATKRLLLLK